MDMETTRKTREQPQALRRDMKNADALVRRLVGECLDRHPHYLPELRAKLNKTLDLFGETATECHRWCRERGDMDPEIRNALEAARHSLVSLSGLTACDGVAPTETFVIDEARVISMIDAVLPSGRGTTIDPRPPASHRRTPVETGTSVVSWDYDGASETLELEYIHGAVYQFFDVPRDVVDGLLAAPSFGAAVTANIRGTYRYARVE